MRRDGDGHAGGRWRGAREDDSRPAQARRTGRRGPRGARGARRPRTVPDGRVQLPQRHLLRHRVLRTRHRAPSEPAEQKCRRSTSAAAACGTGWRRRAAARAGARVGRAGRPRPLGSRRASWSPSCTAPSTSHSSTCVLDDPGTSASASRAAPWRAKRGAHGGAPRVNSVPGFPGDAQDDAVRRVTEEISALFDEVSTVIRFVQTPRPGHGAPACAGGRRSCPTARDRVFLTPFPFAGSWVAARLCRAVGTRLTDPATVCGLSVQHASANRNKRCLLAYMCVAPRRGWRREKNVGWRRAPRDVREASQRGRRGLS